MARRTTTTITSSLALLLPVGAITMAVAGSAQAATPTYYNSLVGFQADVTSTVTDNYQNPAYVFIQSDAVMSAVLGETDYMTTGFGNLNIVSGGVYCAGCNGSFQLSFLTTTVGNAAGVNGVGMNIQFNDPGTPYFAYITFADGTTANIQLPPAGSFWGVAAPERIDHIHFGLSMGGVTQGGSFGIDNLIIGDGNIGGCMVAGDCVDDMNPCTDAVCNANFCAYVANTAPCDDGNPCTDDICGGTTCQGQPNTAPCDDGNMCTDDICGGGSCQGQFNAAPCDDGEVCTENDVCAVGSCQGLLVDCEDGNPCTTNFCDFGVGCDAVNNNNACDDTNACTEGDTCAAGACSGSSIGCSDTDPCTADSCDPVLGCVSDPIAGCCTDDAGCGADETCDTDTNTCISGSSGSSGAGESTGTPADTGVDDTGGSGSGGVVTGGADTEGVDTGIAGSTGADTGPSLDGGEPLDPPSGCGCTTTPSRERLWWLMMAPLGVLLRRRRRAA
jgi:hypothetical protein